MALNTCSEDVLMLATDTLLLKERKKSIKRGACGEWYSAVTCAGGEWYSAVTGAGGEWYSAVTCAGGE